MVESTITVLDSDWLHAHEGLTANSACMLSSVHFLYTVSEPREVNANANQTFPTAAASH